MLFFTLLAYTYVAPARHKDQLRQLHILWISWPKKIPKHIINNIYFYGSLSSFSLSILDGWNLFFISFPIIHVWSLSVLLVVVALWPAKVISAPRGIVYLTFCKAFLFKKPNCNCSLPLKQQILDKIKIVPFSLSLICQWNWGHFSEGPLKK